MARQHDRSWGHHRVDVVATFWPCASISVEEIPRREDHKNEHINRPESACAHRRRRLRTITRPRSAGGGTTPTHTHTHTGCTHQKGATSARSSRQHAIRNYA